MLLAPLSFALHERLLERWLERSKPPEFDEIDGPGNPVIIAGYGRYGQIVSRVLRMAGIPFTAIELDYQQVDFVRRFGNKVYYGDASRLELLESAKARDAKLFVLAIDDVEASLKTAATVRKHFPNLPILARARNRVHLFRLRDLDIDAIERETRAGRASRPPGRRSWRRAWTRRRPRARSTSSARTTTSCWTRSTRCARTSSSSSRRPRNRRRSCRNCSRPT